MEIEQTEQAYRTNLVDSCSCIDFLTKSLRINTVDEERVEKNENIKKECAKIWNYYKTFGLVKLQITSYDRTSYNQPSR